MADAIAIALLDALKSGLEADRATRQQLLDNLEAFFRQADQARDIQIAELRRWLTSQPDPTAWRFGQLSGMRWDDGSYWPELPELEQSRGAKTDPFSTFGRAGTFASIKRGLWDD